MKTAATDLRMKRTLMKITSAGEAGRENINGDEDRDEVVNPPDAIAGYDSTAEGLKMFCNLG
jgi:hypothetical protein